MIRFKGVILYRTFGWMKKLVMNMLFFGMLLLCLFSACSKSPDTLVYEKNTPKPPDSVCDWLSDRKHFHDSTFYQTFQTHYAQQLHEGDLGHAAFALGEMAEQEMYYAFFSDSVLALINSFKANYQKKLPWSQTLFVESYLGNYLVNQSEYRKAIKCFRKLVVHKPFDYSTCTEVAHGYADMAFCYFAMGEHEKAIQNNIKALSWFDKTKSQTGMGGVYDNLALVNLYTKNYRESEKYFEKAMAAYREVGDTANMMTSLHNKILLYEDMESPKKFALIDSTFHFFRKSKMQDESLELGLSSFYVDMLLNEDRYAEAEAVLGEMKVLLDTLNTLSAEADYTVSLAMYQMETGKGIRDVETIKKALRAVEEQDDYQNQIAFLKVLKEDALLKKDYRTAYAYSEREKRAISKITNQRMIAKTLELNKVYETDRKEQQIMNQKQIIADGRLAIAILVSLLMAAVLVVSSLLFRRRQRKNRAERKRVLQYTKKLLEKTEEERKRIASDLHDSISHELLNLKHTMVENPKLTSEKIDAIINDIRIISRNLHPVMFEKVGLTVSVEQLVERAQQINQLMVTSDIDYHASLSVSDELQVYRIIQEALSNTIKYAEAVAAKITIFEEAQHTLIQIKDNGKGFSVEETLRRKDAFGLHNIIERSKAIGGTARIHSDMNGTIVTVELKRNTWT